MRKNHFSRLPKLRTRHLSERLTYAKTGRCAFTLVDVLVVVASIGIMLGLMTPTVHKTSVPKESDERAVIVVRNGWNTDVPETP